MEDSGTTPRVFRIHQQVCSQHCDATGIVHLPRYFEMATHVIERWFDEALDWSYAAMVGSDAVSVPTGRVTARFPAASRLGDHLVWRLQVTRIGQSSIEVVLTAVCGAELRAEMQMTVILSDLGVMRPRRWPDQIRARVGDYLAAEVV